jgi:hypothetical protein
MKEEKNRRNKFSVSLDSRVIEDIIQSHLTIQGEMCSRNTKPVNLSRFVEAVINVGLSQVNEIEKCFGLNKVSVP